MNTADTILRHIRTQLRAESTSIGLDSNLRQEGRLNPADMLELIRWVIDTFNINVENEDFMPEDFATPRRVAAFVRRHNRGVVANLESSIATVINQHSALNWTTAMIEKAQE